jgi:hypothetical protein
MQYSTRPVIATAEELSRLMRERPQPAPALTMDGGVGEAVTAEVSAEKQARIRYLQHKLGAERIRTRSAFLDRSYER